MLAFVSFARAQAPTPVEYCPTQAESKTNYEVENLTEARALNLDEINRHIKLLPPGEDPDIYLDITTKFVLLVLVNEVGQVEQYCITKRTANQYLMQSVIDQLPTLRFTPGTVNGKPVCSWVTVPFQVCLRDPR
jgi:hypothetical protein